MGIDPGTRLLGWGVVGRQGNRLHHVAHGTIRLDAGDTLARRLACIDEQLREVLDTHRPDVGSVESLFFHKDAQAAAKLGHARGVVLLGLARAGIEVAEYAPAKVKQVLTGRGRAEKKQVALMVRAVLALDAIPQADAADALALAITHLRLGPVTRELTLRARKAPDARGNPALARLLAAGGRRGRRGAV